jgi:branched-chain amino acid transport system permease protein
MTTFLVYLIIGITTGAIYAVAASGLVVTYATSRVFNFAHGAIGMVFAFLMYTLWVDNGWNEWLALGLCVLVLAPAMGVLLDILVMRHLERASIALRLAVTLTIFTLLQGAALYIWGTELRSMPPIFGSGSFSPVEGLQVTNDQTATIVIAIVVAVGLWLLFQRTAIGTVMRAVVDDRDLTAMHGVDPRRVTSISWALGCSLAALSAILIAPGLSMSIDALSLLVVSAYAAAIIGGLKSVPVTFAGAIFLGVVTSLLIGYLPPENELVQDLGPALPFLVLFVALVVRRGEIGLQRVEVFNEPGPPRLRTTAAIGVVAVLVAIVVAPSLSGFDALAVGIGLVYAGLLLSLVLMSGMAGQVSLAQLAFAGVGGVVVSHIGDGLPYWLSLLVGVAAAAVVGVLVALPALRLRGLYLALSTLAFAVLMDKVVFVNSHVFTTTGGAIPVRAPEIFGLKADSLNSMIPLLTAVVALYAIGILALRRGRYGRQLAAMRDAPAAASALGMNIVWTKLVVFGAAAGMAGLMGVLWGGLSHQVIASQFNYIASLFALLILVIWGITSVPGAILGAVFYAIAFLYLPKWITDQDLVNLIQPLSVGLAIFGLAQHPEGIVAQWRGYIRRGRFAPRRSPSPYATAVGPAARAQAGKSTTTVAS